MIRRMARTRLAIEPGKRCSAGTREKIAPSASGSYFANSSGSSG
jgi:hypothetical protein